MCSRAQFKAMLPLSQLKFKSFPFSPRETCMKKSINWWMSLKNYFVGGFVWSRYAAAQKSYWLTKKSAFYAHSPKPAIAIIESMCVGTPERQTPVSISFGIVFTILVSLTSSFSRFSLSTKNRRKKSINWRDALLTLIIVGLRYKKVLIVKFQITVWSEKKERKLLKATVSRWHRMICI